MNDTIGVALVKEACPLCGSLHDGPIIMNTRLSKSNAKKVEELHGKTVGMMKEPCDDCKDLMSKGFLLIGIIEEKSDPDNVYRNGNQWVITHDAAKRLFPPEYLTKGATFIDAKAAAQLEFPSVNLEA